MASVQAMLSPTRIANSGRPVLATGAQVRSEFGRTSSYFAVLETTVAGSGGEGHARVRR
jgi:hypothetical protein